MIMVSNHQDGTTPPPPGSLGELLRRAYADDASLRFESISLLLVLAHDSKDGSWHAR